MSSFLSDAEIFDTQSTPLTLPPKAQVQQVPESVKSNQAEESAEESVGSPQFRSLQRRLEQGKRRVLALSILLIIALILIGILIMEDINKLAENPYGKHIGNELKYVSDVLDSENRDSRM